MGLVERLHNLGFDVRTCGLLIGCLGLCVVVSFMMICRQHVQDGLVFLSLLIFEVFLHGEIVFVFQSHNLGNSLGKHCEKKRLTCMSVSE